MAISGVQSPHLAAVNRILAEIGKSIDADGDKGVQVSTQEADKILDEVGKLPPGAQKLVQAELIQLLVNDTFQTTPEAREKFAKHFGVQMKDLEPRARAELVGLSQTTNAFQLGVDAIAQKPKLDRKSMKMLIGKAENFLDLNNQQFLAAVLRNASRDGTIKMDSDARKLFKTWMGGLDQARGVSDWAENFDAPGTGNVDYLSSLMSSGMCFEDLLAAFMIHIAGQMQKEIMEKLREIERSDKLQQEQDQKADGTNKNQVGALADKIKFGGDDATTDTSKPATPTKPSGPDYITQTKRHLEAVVNAVDHYGKADSDGGAMITKDEAAKLAEKLDRIGPPVDKLVAAALHKSLRKTPGIYLESDQLSPMVDYLKNKLGNDIELSALPRGEGTAAKSDLARGLNGTNKLEDKIASFIVDTLLVTDDEKGLKEKMADVKELSSTMRAHAASDAAFQEVMHAEAGPANTNAAPDAGAKKGAEPQPDVPDGTPDARDIAYANAMMDNAGTPPPAAPIAAPPVTAGAAPPVTAGAAAPVQDLAAAVMGDNAPAATKAAQPMDGRSRQVEFEKLKNLQNEFSSIMQAISNVLNSIHQNAMNSIRSIR